MSPASDFPDAVNHVVLFRKSSGSAGDVANTRTFGQLASASSVAPRAVTGSTQPTTALWDGGRPDRAETASRCPVVGLRRRSVVPLAVSVRSGRLAENRGESRAFVLISLALH